MNPKQLTDGSQQAILTLSNKEGLSLILDKIDIAVTNIYDRRKKTSAYFKEELFVAKTSCDDLSRWTLDTDNKLTITIPPPVPQSTGTSAFANLQVGHSYNQEHNVKEYDSTIRFAFKKPLSNMKNTERAVKMAIRYQGTVSISADILNHLDFFSNQPDCVKKLDNYCKRTVDTFIGNNVRSITG